MVSTVLDHVRDTNGAEMRRLSALYAFPDYVKTAAQHDVLPAGNSSLNIYADQVNRLYPCQTAAATWLSTLYFAEKRAEYHPKIASRVADRLESNARYWGIKAETDAIHARHSELNKNANAGLPDSDFGFVWVDDSTGNKIRSCRMKSAAEVKVAAEYLYKYRDSMPFSDRHTIALKIWEKAANYGASLGELETFVEKQAGYGVCKPARVVEAIKQRAKLADDEQFKFQILKLAEDISKSPSMHLQPHRLIKLAQVMSEVDKTLNIKNYSDMIQRPEDFIFEVTYKEAEAGVGNAVALSTGRIYDKSAFKKIALHDVESLMGSDFAAEIADGIDVNPEKLAELAATMPRDDATTFENLLADAGIQPIHQKAANDRFGLTPDVQERMARAY